MPLCVPPPSLVFSVVFDVVVGVAVVVVVTSILLPDSQQASKQ